MDVYVDILFLVNGGMDALCLLLTARLLHRSVSMGRLCLAAALGGLYGVLALFVETAAWEALLVDAAVCLVMSCLVFGWGRLWMTGGVYLLTSMVMGGVMTALYHGLNRAGVSELLPTGEEGLSSLAFVLLATAGGLLTLVWGRIFGRSERRRATQVTVTATMSDRTVTVSGMVDSGNLLTDPLSGTPVIAVKRETLQALVSPELWALLAVTPFPAERLADIPEGARVRLIPVATATGRGMLPALRPDEVVLLADSRKKAVTVKALLCPVPLEETEAEAMVPSVFLT